MNPDRSPAVARYIGYTKGTENHGDEALLWLIRDMLEPEIRVITGADEPYDFALLGGGTLINQSPWLIDFFRQALNQSRTGKGLVLGSGVGDLAFWGNQFDLWKPLLERCIGVGVRGPHSLALLEQDGITGAQWIGDPYLCLHAPVLRDHVPGRLGVNLGGTNNSLWGTNDKEFISYMIEVLRELRTAGRDFVWLSVWTKDTPLLEKVRKAVDPNSPPVLDARTQPLECYSALSGCEVFVGEKLHACAMAAVAGIPFLALEYQPKVRDLAASLGMEDWTLSTAERNPQTLVERIKKLSDSRSDVAAKLISQVEQIRSQIARYTCEAKTIFQNLVGSQL